jgi:hypothetical protein
MSKYELIRLGINPNTVNVDSPNLRLRNRDTRNKNDRILTKNHFSSMKSMLNGLELNNVNSKRDNNSKDKAVIYSNVGDEEVEENDDDYEEVDDNDDNDEVDDYDGERFLQYNEDEDDVSLDEEARANPIVLVKSQKGGRKMFCSGYFYTVESDVGDPPNKRIAWKCERTGNKTQAKCSGRAYTTKLFEPVNVTQEHNHEPEPERLACHEVIYILKH